MGNALINIHRMPLGVGCCYLIQDQGTILIDGGAPNQIAKFIKQMQNIRVNPEAIGLMVMTHGHWDHIGSTQAIKERTGSKVALHLKEKDWLEKSIIVLPPAVTLWGHIIMWVMKWFALSVHIPATTVDIVLEDDIVSLKPFGVRGNILPTPGHSPGSVSVLLDTGEAFVGDLAMNALPMRLGPGLPIFADHMELVRHSWRLLLTHGAKQVFPTHGKPFSIEVIKKAIGY